MFEFALYFQDHVYDTLADLGLNFDFLDGVVSGVFGGSGASFLYVF
jgi:hypothetical protein